MGIQGRAAAGSTTTTIVGSWPTRPKFRLTCCLCDRPVPLASDVYALDAEWQRRFPQMTGVLACGECAVSTHEWACHTTGGEFVPGHLPMPAGRSDLDSWSHIEAQGTHTAMARSYPWSALQQGAGDYLRWLASIPTNSRVMARDLKELQDTIDRWDREHSRTHRR